MNAELSGTTRQILSGRQRRNKRIALGLGIAVSVGILTFLVARYYGAIQKEAVSIEWRWVLFSGFCAFGSYVMVGLALAEVLSLLGHSLTLAEVIGIGLVSTTANYFVSTAGVSGFALKAHLLRKRQVPYGITVTASVLTSAILYIVLAVIIGQGLVYLVMHLQGTRIAIMESALGLLILIAITLPLLVFFFNRRLRFDITKRVFHWLNRGAFFFSKSEIPREDFEEFENQLTTGLESVRNGKGELTRTIAYTALDWALCMTTLYFAFRAVGVSLSVGFLSAGFTAGQAATLIPFLPGGLGVVEAAMPAIFASLGIDYVTALVAVLLYRFVYYLVPGLFSGFVLWGLKVSEPGLLEDTVRETLPEDLRRRAAELERRARKGSPPFGK